LPGGDRRPGGVVKWTDDTIRSTLTEFLRGRATWPGAREFDDAGLHALREALRHHGGPARWSVEMGVAWTPRSRSARPKRRQRLAVSPSRTGEWPKWNVHTIEAALRDFLAGRDDWPRHAEFVAHREGLYQAVRKHGGARAWAGRIGVRWIERKGGHPPVWTEERVRDRLTPLLAGRTTWPRYVEFVEAGEAPLLSAVRRLGGVSRWANEFGLEPSVARGARHPRVIWDEERIAGAIEPLVSELGRWPTKGEFRRAGLGAALAAVYTHGGSRAWQQRFGVAPRDLGGQVPQRQRWTPGLVETELRAFCRGHQVWPSYARFRAAHRADLYHAAARHGGIQFWRSRLGLERGTHTT
jgi:hypothetical protein